MKCRGGRPVRVLNNKILTAYRLVGRAVGVG